MYAFSSLFDAGIVVVKDKSRQQQPATGTNTPRQHHRHVSDWELSGSSGGPQRLPRSPPPTAVTLSAPCQKPIPRSAVRRWCIRSRAQSLPQCRDVWRSTWEPGAYGEPPLVKATPPAGRAARGRTGSNTRGGRPGERHPSQEHAVSERSHRIGFTETRRRGTDNK